MTTAVASSGTAFVWQQVGSAATADGVAVIGNDSGLKVKVLLAPTTPTGSRGHPLAANDNISLPAKAGDIVWYWGAADAVVAASLI